MAEIHGVDLGFSEPTVPGEGLDAAPKEWDGGRLGGLSVWLGKDSIPSCKALKCVRCGTQMVFLAQLFAPIDSADCGHDEAYYRMLYVFSCRNGRCINVTSRSGEPHPSICVLRSQCFKADIGDRASVEGRACGVCGLAGDSRCSRCKLPYCCREHQALHWQQGHREQCGKLDGPAARASALEAGRKAGLVLRASDVVIEHEEDVLGNNDENMQNGGKVGQKWSSKASDDDAAGGRASGNDKAGSTGAKDGAGNDHEHVEDDGEPTIEDLTQQELADTTGTGHAVRDPVLHFFMRRAGSGEAAAQVVRYCRWPKGARAGPDGADDSAAGSSGSNAEDDEDEEGEFSVAPLWFTSSHRPRPEDIPACERCGAARAFEFQLMPQALNYCGNDAWATAMADSQLTAMEWGTIAVYTCTASCSLSLDAPIKSTPTSDAAAGAGGSAGGAGDWSSVLLPGGLTTEYAWVQPSATGDELESAKAAAQLQLRYLHEPGSHGQDEDGDGAEGHGATHGAGGIPEAEEEEEEED